LFRKASQRGGINFATETKGVKLCMTHKLEWENADLKTLKQ